MEGYIGEIRLFGGTFAPQNWMFCKGQPLPINGYETIFTLIGTTYGGDGVTTFNLPNLQSRVAVGAGVALGSNVNYIIGQTSGTEGVTLTATNLPFHGHNATSQAGSGSVTATLTLNAAAGAVGGESNPANNLIGSESSTSAYSDNTGHVPTSPMASAAVAFPPTMLSVQANSGISGMSAPHENRQPLLATNYIICVQGIFPSRD